MIAQFTLRLICGISLMWAVMPRNQVTSGFFRIQMLLVMALSVLSALAIHQFEQPVESSTVLSSTNSFVGCVVLAAASFLGSVFWTLERRQAGTVQVFCVAALSTIVLLLSFVSLAEIQSVEGLLFVLSEFSAASLLGAAMTGMLLGHWYLTSPTMSTAPLNRMTVLFGVTALLRLFVAGGGLLMAGDQLSGQTHLMWLSLRWTAGIVGPLVLSVMIWRILKFKNTQSATGVFFAGVILTFIGELTADLLFRDLHIPL